MIKTSTIEYQCDGQTFLGFGAFPDNKQQKSPVVLIGHDWTGRNEFACEKAKKFAEAGYVGFAMDMFGEARLGTSNEEKTALIEPLMHDRQLLRERLLVALTSACQLDEVDSDKVAAVGFCFGGLCVLDLARSGAPVRGVVSVHGLLLPPENSAVPASITSKVLALHGYDDPMVLPDQIDRFAEEMTALKADWQIHLYGNTMHGFTNPLANDPNFGAVYSKIADQRSRIAMDAFLKEVFS